MDKEEVQSLISDIVARTIEVMEEGWINANRVILEEAQDFLNKEHINKLVELFKKNTPGV